MLFSSADHICQLLYKHQPQKKSASPPSSSSSSCTKRNVFFFSFFFFSPNPVKLFLRADQCLHTSLLQLINDYPLIPLLSALFICLLLLPVILPCLLLLCPRSHCSPPSPLPPFSNLTIKDLCIHSLHNWLDYRTVGPRLQWFCISFVIFVSVCGHFCVFVVI